MSLTVYCAAPISGNNYRDVFAYFDDVSRKLREVGICVWRPLSEVELLHEEQAEPRIDTHPSCTPQAIFRRDRWMVERADVIYINFVVTRMSGGTQLPSIGCCMELAMAAQAGKHTVVVLPGDSCHRHPFVLAAADIIFESADEALDYLATLAEGVA